MPSLDFIRWSGTCLHADTIRLPSRIEPRSKPRSAKSAVQNSSSYVALDDVPYGSGKPWAPKPWALTLWAKPGSLFGPGFEYLFSHNQSAPSPDVLPNQVSGCREPAVSQPCA